MTAFNYTHTCTRRHTHSLVAQECPGSVPPSANREADKATKIKGAQHDYVLDNCEGAALMWHSVCPSDQTHMHTYKDLLSVDFLHIYCRNFLYFKYSSHEKRGKIANRN